LLALSVPVVVFGASDVPVSAGGCSVQAGSFITGSYYSNSNIALIVPIAAQCSFSGGQLTAVGNATETLTGANFGSSNTLILPYPANGLYKGQLVFTLPTGEEWHRIQVSISIYDGGQLGMPMLKTSETAAVDPNTKYISFSSCYYDYACDTLYNYCQSPNNNGTMQCVGYLQQDHSGCLELVIPIFSPYGFLSYQYYTLQNATASSVPQLGTWAIVNGQLHQGYNTTPIGAACPGNYIDVSSISP
jgi:hypothetical protein